MRRNAAAHAALLLTIAATGSASAAEYSVAPGAEAGVVFSDNRRLLSSEDDEAADGQLRLWSDFKAATESTELTLRPTLLFRRVSSSELADSDNQSLESTLTHTGERFLFELPASVRRDTTQSDEFIDEVDDQDRETQVAVERRIRRLRTSVAPSFTYRSTERLTLQTSASLAETRFSSALDDFRYLASVSQASYALTERDTISASANASRLESVGSATELELDSIGGTVGYSRQLTDSLDLSTTAGWITSRSKFNLQNDGVVVGRDSNSDSGLQASLRLRKQLQTGVAEVSLAQRRSPTASGGLAENQRVEGLVSVRVTPRLRATGTASFERREVISRNDNDSDRDRYTGGLALNYTLTEQWSVISRYRYRHNENSASGDTADSNSLEFVLRFEGRPMSISR